MTTQFEEKSALITGAASGIGAATARWLAAQGIARLVLVDRNADGLEALHLGCPCVFLAGDVADEGLSARVEAEGPLDFALINAGVALGSPIEQESYDVWRRVIATNLDGAFLMLRAAMRAIPGRGSIVLTSSVSATRAAPGTAAYGASKAALIQLARVAALEGAARGLRVNAIAPGGVDTPIWEQTPFFRALVEQHEGDRAAAMQAMAGMATPLGRFATADEIAAQIGFLLSDAAATITGSVLLSDGGYSA